MIEDVAALPAQPYRAERESETKCKLESPQEGRETRPGAAFGRAPACPVPAPGSQAKSGQKVTARIS